MMSLAQSSIEARYFAPFSSFLLLGSVVLATCAASASSAQVPTTPAGPSSGGQAPAQTPAPPAVQATAAGAPSLRLTGFTFTASADLSETYTTNSYGVGGSDFITSAGLNLAAHNHTLRFDGDMALRLVGNYYANNPTFSDVHTYLTAVASAEIIPEHFRIQGTAFAEPMLINNLGPLGADDRPVAGSRDVYGYTVTPTFAFRLGEFATSTTTATQSSVFYIQPNGPTVQAISGLGAPTQSLSYGAAERFASGSAFFRLNWAVTGAWNYSESAYADQTGNLQFTTSSAIGDIKYALSREVAVLGTFGYQSLTSNQPLSEDLQGPVLLGGLQLTLGPNFEMNGMAGEQYNSPSYIGNLTYRAGPFTTFTTSLTDIVTTPTGRLLDRSTRLGVNGQGGFVDTGYPTNPAVTPPVGSPVTGFDPLPIDGIGITNSIQRYRSLVSSLVYTVDRTQYLLTGFATIYDTLTVVPSAIPTRGRSRGGQFSIYRTMTPQLTGGLDLGYTIEDTLGGQYNLFRGMVNANYNLSLRTAVFMTAAYVRRHSDDDLIAMVPSSADTSETSVTIGIRRQLR